MPDEKPKRPRGRPALGDAKLKPIPVRFDSIDGAALKVAATEDGISDAEWIRRVVHKALGARTPLQGDPICSSMIPSSSPTTDPTKKLQDSKPVRSTKPK